MELFEERWKHNQEERNSCLLDFILQKTCITDEIREIFAVKNFMYFIKSLFKVVLPYNLYFSKCDIFLKLETFLDSNKLNIKNKILFIYLSSKAAEPQKKAKNLQLQKHK